MPRTTAPLFGYLGTLHFTIEMYQGDDAVLYNTAREKRRDFEEGIREQIREILGQQYELLELRLARGSLTVTIVLSAIGTIYVTMSQYEDFLKGVHRLVQQLKGFFRRFFERTLSRQLPADTTVIGSWQPGPTVTSAPQVFATHPDGIDASLVLILYLAITNAAMIAALIWIALHHAR